MGLSGLEARCQHLCPALLHQQSVSRPRLHSARPSSTTDTTGMRGPMPAAVVS